MRASIAPLRPNRRPTPRRGAPRARRPRAPSSAASSATSARAPRTALITATPRAASRSRRERSRRSSAGSRSLATSSAIPATAPRSVGGVQSAPSARERDHVGPRALHEAAGRIEQQRLLDARRARRIGRERLEQPVGQLVAAREQRARVRERRGHRAPRGRIVAEAARHAHHVQRAVAVARQLEPHHALAAEERGRGELAERAPQEVRVDGRKAERVGVAHEAPHVSLGEARRARADPHARVAAARLAERRVVGAHDRGVGGAQRFRPPRWATRAPIAVSACRAGRSRSASGRCRSGAGVRS